MLDVAMIERGLEKTGKSKGGLAAAMGVRPGAVSEILGGERLVKASEIIPIMEYLELNLAPIMGRVGAGAVIEPDYEQVPPEGLGDIALPFPIMEETIAFEIVGDSMLPKYESGDVIVVYKDQRHPLSSFYGEEAVVRLKTGERYLKTIERGKSPSVVNLSSFNAKQIVGVKLEWVGEICLSTVDDPAVTSYALFLESLRHSEDLAAFARVAHEAGKPVAVYKLGRSDEAAALTVSHTGALAGEDAESEAFFR